MTPRSVFVAACVATVCMPWPATLAQPASPLSTSEQSANHEALYRSGITYEAFLDGADRRRTRWLDNTETASAPAALLTRVEAAGGPFYLLAVAVAGCSDSVNTIPYLAALVDRSENLEMRIVDADAGEDLMMSHRTPDGRPATPTVLVLNEQFNEVGAFVERPVELQNWALSVKDSLSADDYLEQKFAWYDADRGYGTMEEVVALMEFSRMPEELTGSFEDDYGIRYAVNASTWIQGAGGEAPSVHHVVEWNVEDEYVIARNDAANEYAPGRWTRIDWMSLEDIDDMDPYTWAFCLTAYDAPDADAARSSVSADRSSPRSGCDGHPFSRMKPFDGQ